MRAYASHSLKVFNVQTLDLKKVAKSFGFETPPWVGMLIILIDPWTMVIFFLDLDVVGVRKKEGRKERQQGKKGGKRMLK